ncbi:hypothetical protein VI817_001944 [Penicillium citrinum]|nr:hypothetical protein VI817_001944 [Penicillium citrinum]
MNAVAAAKLPSAFTLVADGGKTVLTDGQSLWVGANTTTHEIAIRKSLHYLNDSIITPNLNASTVRSGQNGAVSFTSKNGVPTAFQSLYIVENSVSPVGLTVPHSGATPEGATTLGFDQTEKGYFAHKGKDWYSVDVPNEAGPKEIFWYGAHNAEYGAINLWVKEFKE